MNKIKKLAIVILFVFTFLPNFAIAQEVVEKEVEPVPASVIKDCKIINTNLEQEYYYLLEDKKNIEQKLQEFISTSNDHLLFLKNKKIKTRDLEKLIDNLNEEKRLFNDNFTAFESEVFNILNSTCNISENEFLKLWQSFQEKLKNLQENFLEIQSVMAEIIEELKYISRKLD